MFVRYGAFFYGTLDICGIFFFLQKTHNLYVFPLFKYNEVLKYRWREPIGKIAVFVEYLLLNHTMYKIFHETFH